MTIETFIQEIREAIAETISDFPNTPETDVTREIVEGMLLGEDCETVEAVRRRFGLEI